MTEMTTEDRSQEDRSHSDPDVDSSSGNGFLKELLRTGLIVMLIVLPIRLFIAQPFIVSGASMQPTLDTGDYLVIDQISYEFNPPQRNDVVVFRYPNDPEKFYIKRIIGLPGETVEIADDTTTITNSENPNGFVLDESYVTLGSIGNQTVNETLAENEYFVLGDNRKSSSDSRVWGPLPQDNLVGRALLRLLPLDKIEITPGQPATAVEP